MNAFGTSLPEVFMRGLHLSLLLLLFPPLLCAQEQVVASTELDSGMAVRFRIAGKEREGALVSVNQDSLVILRRGVLESYRTAEAADLAYGAGKRRRVLLGMGTGLAAGGLLALFSMVSADALYGESFDTDKDRGRDVLVMLGGGIVLGGLLAVAIPLQHWVSVQVPRVTPALVPVVDGIGLGFRVGY